MKNAKFILLALIGLSGAALFYNQSFGLNTILFSFLITIIQIFERKKLSTPLIILNISSIGIFISPSGFLIFLWFFNFFYLSKLNRKTAIIFSPIASIHSALLLLKSVPNNGTSLNSKHLLVGLTSLVIVSVFIVLYALSNPLINNFLSDINLSYISGEWISITAVFSFIGALTLSDTPLNWFKKHLFKSNHDQLDEIESKDYTQTKKLIAKITLIALSTILTIINGVDLVVLTNEVLPQGFTLSQYLHQGFFTLIFSMSLAIVLILYFFGGNINFEKDIKPLKTIAYIWIAQNGVLILTTLFKNFNYISTYGLTYKRVSVVLCLMIIASALFLTYIKVSKNKNLWYYLNLSSIILTTHIVLFFSIPWDLIICNYNINSFQGKVDYAYLLRLDNPNWNLLKRNEAQMTNDDFLFFTRLIERRKQKNTSFLSTNMNSIQFEKTFK